MVLEIVKYGDPVLRAKGKRVETVSEEIKQLAADMIDTMNAARGLGLAAQQVGVPLQLTVVDVGSAQQDRPSSMTVNGQPVELEEHMPMTLLNPHLELSAERDTGNEGCLSFPDMHADILRASKVKVRAGTLEGGEVEFEATGLLARAIQHETDHLHGILFIDRMSSAAKAGLAGRLKRLQKEGAAIAASSPKGARPAKLKPVAAK